jgi:hypothetical protein
MGIWKRPPEPPVEPEPESPKAEPVPEPARPRAIPHRACGGEAKRHCRLVEGKSDSCTWRICSCGKWGRMKWMPELGTWRTTWRAMAK